MKKTLSFLLVLSTLASCSKIEHAEKTMDNMKNNTSSMKKTTEEMKESTGFMVDSLRQKETKDTRDKQIRVMNNPYAKFGSKAVAAVTYFKSMEYQHWNPTVNTYDNMKTRYELELTAAKEFFYTISDYYGRIGNKKVMTISPLKIKENAKKNRDNDLVTFFAFAANLHESEEEFHRVISEISSNDKYKNLRTYDHYKMRTSMLKMIVRALYKEKNKKPLTRAEEFITTGANRDMAIALLQARFHMITALAMKNIATKDRMSLWQKIRAGLGGKVQLAFTYHEKNSQTQSDVTKKLISALDARRVLLDMNEYPYLDRKLLSGIQNLDISVIEEKNSLTSNQIKFLSAINVLKNHTN